MEKIYTLLSAFVLLAVSCTGSDENQYPEVRIACIGDSITWGAGLEDRFNQSYPAVLDSLLGDGYVVKGFGFNSRTASLEGDFPYFQAKKYDTLKLWLPDVVTIMLGTNDSKPHNWDAANYHEGLRTLIDDLRNIPSHPRIILLTPTPAGSNHHTIDGEVIRDEVIPELKKVAARRWLDVVDLYTPMMDHMDLFPDEVHPGKEASAMIASLIADALPSFGIKPGPRVMFVGDSITDGFWGRKDGKPSSERSHYDLNHVYGHGYQADAIGRMMLDRPELNIRCYNRGWSGNTLVKIRARWAEEVMTVRPTVISLLVGVNDSSAGSKIVDKAEWEAMYRNLIDTTLSVLPKVKFVLCTPFLNNAAGFQRSGDEEEVKALAEIVRGIARDYGFVCVDFASIIDARIRSCSTSDLHYWLWDGVHPTYAAHTLFADEWIETVYQNNII